MTIVKSSCWLNYQVLIDVMDAHDDQKITTITVPSGKLWTRQSFNCQSKEVLKLQAMFSPKIWEHDTEKTYAAKHFWRLPDQVNPDDQAWNVTICYPDLFAQVPSPGEDNGHCACDMAAIPPPQ